MGFPVQRSKVVRIENAFLQDHQLRLVVWWYGRILKNPREDSTPWVDVVFRRFDAGSNEPSTWFVHPMALTHLGLLRIGSIWENGVSNERIAYSEEEFTALNFSAGSWRHTSPLEENERGHSALFSRDGYPLQRPWDPSFLLEFPLPDGRRLLVPCLEFFTRYYGHHVELRRVLATYPWDEVKRRVLVPLDGPIEPGTWPVKLARKMGKDDAVFLAHVEYSAYTRGAAQDIYSQTEAAFTGVEKKPVSLRVRPWFQGPAQLKAKGVWLEDGRTFLALRILGRSEPSGETVIHDRDRPEGIDRSGEEGSEPRSSIRNVRHLPYIIDLTSNEAPDHGSLPIDIEEDEIEIMGELREVLDRKQAVARGLIRNVFSGDSIRTVSTGESYGNGKGVGYGDLHSPAELPSYGVLQDMWDAAHKLRGLLPDVVRSVGAFTFENGVGYDSKPKMILLKPFSSDEDRVDRAVKRWVYVNWKKKEIRGVLVMLIEVENQIVCIVEPQRTQKSKKNATKESGEVPLSGLVFVLRGQDNLSMLMSSILEEIRQKKGVAARVADALLGESPIFAFRHERDGERYPCELAIRNALRKVGIVLPRLAKHADKS